MLSALKKSISQRKWLWPLVAAITILSLELWGVQVSSESLIAIAVLVGGAAFGESLKDGIALLMPVQDWARAQAGKSLEEVLKGLSVADAPRIAATLVRRLDHDQLAALATELGDDTGALVELIRALAVGSPLPLKPTDDGTAIVLPKAPPGATAQQLLEAADKVNGG